MVSNSFNMLSYLVVLLKRVLFVAAIFALIFLHETQAVELRVLTTTEPPYNYFDNAKQMAAGYSVDVATAVMKRAKVGILGGHIQVMPWARLYLTLKTEPNVLAFTVTRTEERENLFQWVGPVAPRAYWLWTLEGRDDIVIETAEDLLRYRVGGVREFASTKRLTELGFKPDKNLITINTPVQNYKLLFRGRIDLLPDLELGVAYQLKNLGKEPDLLKKIYLLDDRYKYYLGVSKSTSPDIVKKLQTALETLKSEGKIDAIMETYIKGK